MAGHPSVPPQERGVALLTVLLLVAVMSVIAAAAFGRLNLATRLGANSIALDQARQYAFAAESLTLLKISDLTQVDAGKTLDYGGWNGRPLRLPVQGGLATATIRDGGNCFNLNSVAQGQLEGHFTARPLGIQEFVGLMTVLGIAPGEASVAAASLADWIDSDAVPAPLGAEDQTYLQRSPAYRAANRLLVDRSELRAVNGVTPEIYATLKPWICALPTTQLSPININTLKGEQAPLLAMLGPDKMTIDMARQLIEQRPAEGYGSIRAFWNKAGLNGDIIGTEAQGQVKLVTRWFTLDTVVELGDAEIDAHALIDAQKAPAHIVYRQWGELG